MLRGRVFDEGGSALEHFPVEDWIVLGRDEWEKLSPRPQVQVGDAWAVDRKISARLLTHFYPPTENNDVSKNRFERQSLKATVVSIHNGEARARIEGELRMQHSFYHKEDGKVVEATVVGFFDFEPSSRNIRSFQLVTDQATYSGGTFGVVVRSK